MKCLKCNTENLNSNRYCKKCGYFLENLKKEDYSYDSFTPNTEISENNSHEESGIKKTDENSSNLNFSFPVSPHPLLTGFSNTNFKRKKSFFEYLKTRFFLFNKLLKVDIRKIKN